MVVQISKLIIFAFFLSNFVEAKNKCFKEGVTWNTQGQLEFIPRVDFQECTSAFVQNSGANGFTWFEDFNGYKDICIIFGELDGKQSCKNCLSFKQKVNCACEQQQGQCEITEDNFISASYAESEVECYIQCSAVDGCQYYTWLSEDHDTFYEQCLLFSSCDTVYQCKQGCFVGSVDCDISPTTPTTPVTMPTTTVVTTSTTAPDPCDDYHVLDDETRNFNYGYRNQYCDDAKPANSRCKSPDWKGTSWYRFDGPGGTKIAEKKNVDNFHCNTYAPGVLVDGTHPTTVGETVNGKVCFNYDYNRCHKIVDIQIKNCGAYFLYYLENMSYGVTIEYRYCSELNSE